MVLKSINWLFAFLSSVILSNSVSLALDAASPWTPQRARALVFVSEESSKLPRGSGFIVKGNGDSYFIVTATHVVIPNPTGLVASSQDCVALPKGLSFQEGNKGGSFLVADCVFHIGRDVSLIRLFPRDGNYYTLEWSTPDVPVGEVLFIGGFPLGGDRDVSRYGKVTSVHGGSSSNNLVLDTLTAPGLSGGPHLEANGSVVAIHAGGEKYTAGFAQAVPLWQLKPDLDHILGMPRPPPDAIEKLVTTEDFIVFQDLFSSHFEPVWSNATVVFDLNRTSDCAIQTSRYEDMESEEKNLGTRKV